MAPYMGDLIDSDAFIASFINQLLQALGQLEAKFATAGVAAHVSAYKEPDAFEITPTTLQNIRQQGAVRGSGPMRDRPINSGLFLQGRRPSSLRPAAGHGSTCS